MIVGFSAYLVLNKYSTSQTTAKSEAGTVEELYWLAEQLPEPKRDEIQELAKSYARVVVDEEWPLMRQGQESPRAGALEDDLRRSIQDFELSSDLWIVLISIGVDTILFTFFVGMKNA